jgi:two-component system, OmpR family, phosphate regulon sensor histidine kinase PhoR
LETVLLAQSDGLSKSVEIIDRMPYARRVLVSISPLDKRSENNRPARLLVQFRDVSEQDRLAQMRSDFIANASHELRTPLASLKGFIETLQGPASNDAAARKRFLAIMEAQAARMARILDDLLSLSRIEMRVHVTPSDTIEISNLVRDVAQGLEPIARNSGISLQYDTAHETALVKGDRDELVQVFQNLIQNAIKYGNPGGHVGVSVRRELANASRVGRVVVSIADDGPGIADVHLPRLTERFYRVDTAASREKGGTGLGLAIVKHILNRHRGELKIISTPGKGSTFSVVLDAIGKTDSHEPSQP